MKHVAGTTVALMGVAPLSARRKAVGVELTDPEEAVSQSVKQAQRAGAQMIVLLSQLGEHDDRIILSQVDGIDVVLSGQVRGEGNAGERIGNRPCLPLF